MTPTPLTPLKRKSEFPRIYMQFTLLPTTFHTLYTKATEFILSALCNAVPTVTAARMDAWQSGRGGPRRLIFPAEGLCYRP